jgi:hypothetical protein
MLACPVEHFVMAMNSISGQRRVFVPQAMGADEFLRVTWHEGRRVMVFSHWDGDLCVAAMPIRVEDLGELAELTVTALVSAQHTEVWAPPLACHRLGDQPPTATCIAS